MSPETGGRRSGRGSAKPPGEPAAPGAQSGWEAAGMSVGKGARPLAAPCGWWAPCYTADGTVASGPARRLTAALEEGPGERRWADPGGLLQEGGGFWRQGVSCLCSPRPLCPQPSSPPGPPPGSVPHSMSRSFGESCRVGSTSGAHAIAVFCSWDHKVTQKRASRLQHDNIRTQLKVSRPDQPGAGAPYPEAPEHQFGLLSAHHPGLGSTWDHLDVGCGGLVL